MRQGIIIDGVRYDDVSITSLKRSADILDKSAHRSEDGELHREVIGTYYNYTLELAVYNNDALYDELFYVLSAPEAYHDIVMPHDGVAFRGYFASVKDEIDRLTDTGAKCKGLSCSLIAVSPSRKPQRRGSL